MRRLRTLLVPAFLAPVALIVTPANAAGPDVVAGGGTVSSVSFALTSGATDRTPGVGRDASGMISVKFAPEVGIDDTARVVCVSATGNAANVVAETVQHRGTRVDAVFWILSVTDGG